MRTVGWSGVLALTLVVGACERGAETPEVQEWVLVEDLRIGGTSEPLTRLGPLLPFSDGSLWVLQPGEPNIRAYAADGSLTLRIGEPGEFTLPSRMGWWSTAMDSIWVSDLGQRRVSLFSVGGTFAGSIDMPFLEYEEVFTVNQPMAVLPDASALAVAGYAAGVSDWVGFPLLRYSLPVGRVQREIARLERTSSVVVRWKGEAVSTVVTPFPDSPIVAFGPRGTEIVIVERSVTDPSARGRIAVHGLSPAGDTTWSKSYPYDAQPLPAAEAEALIAPRVASLKQFARLDGSLTEAEAEEAYRNSVPVPAFRTPIQSVHVGSDGWIWLEWSPAALGAGHWWVLAPDGTAHAKVTFERPLDIRAVGHGWVWAVETTPDGATYVVRYRAGEAG
jgi:hypothetical protein